MRNTNKLKVGDIFKVTQKGHTVTNNVFKFMSYTENGSIRAVKYPNYYGQSNPITITHIKENGVEKLSKDEIGKMRVNPIREYAKGGGVKGKTPQEVYEQEQEDAMFNSQYAKGSTVKGKDLSGNYFSTNDFVGVHKLEKQAEKTLGKGWEAEDDVNQIKSIINGLGGKYVVTVPEDRSQWNEMREQYDLANPTNDSNYDIFVISESDFKFAKGSTVKGANTYQNRGEWKLSLQTSDALMVSKGDDLDLLKGKIEYKKQGEHLVAYLGKIKIGYWDYGLNEGYTYPDKFAKGSTVKGGENWYTTIKPNEKLYVKYDFARSSEQAKNMLRDLAEGSPIAHKSTSEGGLYNVYVKRGSIFWREKGGNLNDSMFKIGDKVKVASDNDNENYDKFRGKTLIVTHVAKNTDEHRGYDNSMEGMALYDFKGVPFSLYEYELESSYAKGGGVDSEWTVTIAYPSDNKRSGWSSNEVVDINVLANSYEAAKQKAMDKFNKTHSGKKGKVTSVNSNTHKFLDNAKFAKGSTVTNNVKAILDAKRAKIKQRKAKKK